MVYESTDETNYSQKSLLTNFQNLNCLKLLVPLQKTDLPLIGNVRKPKQANGW